MELLNITHFLEQWIHAHPQWLFLFILAVALAETLAIVGMIIPGVLLLFGAGTLVGKGFLSLKVALLAAWAGAFIGDIVSYYVGIIFHAHIREWRLFKKHKTWVDKGEAFFLKHGTLSVFTGRFAGPLRAIIPLIAGMMDMPAIRFILTVFIAGALWSPLYLIPGYLVGASMHWTQFVSQEFFYTVISIGVVSLVASFLYMLCHQKLSEYTLLAKKSVLLILSVIFIALAICVKTGLLNTINEDFAMAVVHGETLLSTQIAVAITMLGSTAMRILLALLIFFSLWFWGNKKNAIRFGCILVGLFLVVGAFKYILNIPRPSNMLLELHYSFPSGHTAFLTFFAFVIAERITSVCRSKFSFIIWTIAIFISLMTAISRLYLNMHWITDVSGAFILGTMAYKFWRLLEHNSYQAKPLRHPVFFCCTLLIFMFIGSAIGYPFTIIEYTGL